jgi:hypothetical protein
MEQIGVEPMFEQIMKETQINDETAASQHILSSCEPKVRTKDNSY